MPKRRKRTSYLQYKGYVAMEIKPVVIWGYGRNGKFVCRVSINRAGLELYSGTKGTKRIADLPWERLVERLTK
jgi:hypothetical protein